MKLSYYPGCSLQGTARDYDLSVREVCKALDIELVEIPDWNCCGASSAHMTDHEIGMRLPMRNLLLSQPSDLDILVPCAACFQRLKAADKAMRKDPEFWDLKDYSPDFKIVHISSLLSDPDLLQRFGQKSSGSLNGMPIACYYGCLSLRNPKITDAASYETPKTLEAIVESLGGVPVSWSHRTECCSGSLTMARPDIAERLVADIASAAEHAGATAFVTDCPMCQANVESRQQVDDTGKSLPVFFATELMVAALKGEYPEKQKKLHLISADILNDHLSTASESREESP